MSLVMVPATPVNVKAPIKFITAAIKIAVLGVNALVDTAVACIGFIMESIDKVKYQRENNYSYSDDDYI